MSRGLSSEAGATLQASIGLPPPNATSASASTRSASATRARAELAGTCCPTPANTPAQCGPIAAVTRSRSGEAPKVLPVATSARRAHPLELGSERRDLAGAERDSFEPCEGELEVRRIDT